MALYRVRGNDSVVAFWANSEIGNVRKEVPDQCWSGPVSGTFRLLGEVCGEGDKCSEIGMFVKARRRAGWGLIVG